MTQNFPRWLVELQQALPICGQFLISGNVRDTYLIPSQNGEKSCALIPSVWECLQSHGFEFLLVYDRVRHLYLHKPNTEKGAALGKLNLGDIPNLEIVEGFEGGDVSPSCLEEQLPDVFEKIVGANDTQCALVVDFASRLVPDVTRLDDGMIDFFVATQKISSLADPRPLLVPPLFNPIIWVVDNERDLPDWFVVGNERIRTITVPLPDIDTRRRKAQRLAGMFPYANELEADELNKLIDQFAKRTDRMKLNSLSAISALARAQGSPLTEISETVRSYKVGVPDNPWARAQIRRDIGQAEEKLTNKIHGQDHAIGRVTDILMRSVVGLTGAQSSGNPGRPRGVLFFAGPTGVGKTMLAKAITKLVFGDEQAYIRFDMSEFSAEHSDARLIGAPPGYTGYDSGGQLVNAIRQRPFSVLLFDEIEKAHPRILDKFLQILEDGRLTDGRGETVFFSEAIIIFTSNLGMFEEKVTGFDEQTGMYRRDRVETFDAMDPPEFEELEESVKKGIENHFKNKLERPELLNRIGDNFVIFNFIRKDVAEMIFDDMLENVRDSVREQHGVDVDCTEVRGELLATCTKSLQMGGRGIGNVLETAFINPLARVLFHSEAISRQAGTIFVRSLNYESEKNKYSLEIDESPN